MNDERVFHLGVVVGDEEAEAESCGGLAIYDARGHFCDVWCVFDVDTFELCDQGHLKTVAEMNEKERRRRSL